MKKLKRFFADTWVFLAAVYVFPWLLGYVGVHILNMHPWAIYAIPILAFFVSIPLQINTFKTYFYLKRYKETQKKEDWDKIVHSIGNKKILEKSLEEDVKK